MLTISCRFDTRADPLSWNIFMKIVNCNELSEYFSEFPMRKPRYPELTVRKDVVHSNKTSANAVRKLDSRISRAQVCLLYAHQRERFAGARSDPPRIYSNTRRSSI
jgi:hypothetical protein